MFDVDKFLFHALLLFLMSGGITGLLVGSALVLRPDWLLRISEAAGFWVATRKISSLLEHVFKIDYWLYRHHKVSGALLLAGAISLIYFYTVRFDKLPVLISFSVRYGIPPIFTEILVDSAVFCIFLGAAFALIISLFLMIRPSMLKDFERGANRWISLRRALKPFERLRSGVDEYAFRNAQMTGVLLLVASLYTLAGLTIWL